MYLMPEFGSFKVDFNFNSNFRLVSFDDVFSAKSYEYIESSFNNLDWEKKESHFYQQYSSKIKPNSGHPLSSFYYASSFNVLKSKLEPLLGVRLRNSFSMVAHKLVTAQEIDIHNDYCDPEMGYENFRLIFQFARKKQLKNGGELSFLYSQNKQDVIRKYDYSPNKAICFEISPYSYHFVSPVEGERHTLVMYLWDVNKKYDGSAFEVINE